MPRRTEAERREAEAKAFASLGLRLETGSERSVQEQLREAVAANAAAVVDVFKALDANGDGVPAAACCVRAPRVRQAHSESARRCVLRAVPP
eukprot:5563305-Prymnesium_polylepis.2